MNKLSVRAMARPSPLAIPARKGVSAFTPPTVYDRWDGGIKSLSAGDNVITMFEEIGEDFWSGGGVTAKKVSAQLRAIGDRAVEIQMNSPGGDFFEGIAIYNILREHPQPITVKVMGVAASAASVIAMAGDDIQIAAASFFMIHNASVLAYGNRHDMTELAAFLAPFDAAMSAVYSERTGQALEDVIGWQDAETWMTGAEAIDRGFADALLSADEIGYSDADAATARSVNDIRALELQLVAGGATRTEARERINRIKGTPGAAQKSGTPGAAGSEWAGYAARLLETLEGRKKS